MMPLFPAHAFIKLTEQSIGMTRRSKQALHGGDQDHVLDYEALTPDPVLMGLRRLVQTSPIGSLMRTIDRWLEARDERRYGQVPDRLVANSAPPKVVRANPDHDSAADQDERIAA